MFISAFLFYPDLLISQPENNNSPESEIDTAHKDTTIQDTLQYPVSSSALEEIVDYSARDSIRFELTEETAYLFGEASIKYENMEINAPYIKIDWKKSQINAESFHPEDTVPDTLARNVILRDGQREYFAERTVYNIESDEGLIYKLFTQEDEGFIHGDIVKRDSLDNFYINEAKYTTCDRRENPHFYLSARRLKVTSENQIVSGPANLVVANIPLPLALPFGFFPDQTRRSSGVIPPSYGDSRTRGFSLTDGGYYLALSDYFDLALTGDIYSKGSWRLNASSDYILRNQFDGYLDFNLTNRVESPETPDEVLSRDYSITWRHQQDPRARPHSDFRADVNIESPAYSINHAREYQQQIRSISRSNINYSRDIPNSPFNMSGGLTHVMDRGNEQISMDAPEFSFNMARITPFKSDDAGLDRSWYEDVGVDYSLNFNNEIDAHQDTFYTREVLSEINSGANHSMNIRPNLNVSDYFTFNPRLSYNGLIYFDRTIQEIDEEQREITERDEQGFFTTHDFATGADLDTRIYGFFNINRLGFTTMRHVLEPRIGVSYRPDLTHSYLGYHRETYDDNWEPTTYSPYAGNIYGAPRRNRRASVDFGVDNNFEIKRTESTDDEDEDPEERKITIIDNLSASSGYNFAADSMGMDNISLRMRTNFLNRIQANMRATLNPYAVDEENQVYDKFQFSEDYRPGRLTNFSMNLSTSLNPAAFGGDGRVPAEPGPHRFYHHNRYTDFDLPWDINLNYSMSYNPQREQNTTSQTISAGGMVRLTDQWNTNVDLEANLESREMTSMRLSINRDLHCWQLSFNWTPLGTPTQQGFRISIRPKASILQDLDLERERRGIDY